MNEHKRKLIPVILVLTIMVMGSLFFAMLYQITTSDDGGKGTLLRKVLAKEFSGAYEHTIKANGNIVELDITADENTIEIVEGVQTKVWAYNGTVPGPEIRMKLGDTLVVNFTNNLPQETTVHFHGIRVPNAMDGVPGVTQDPIQPGEKFVYRFTPKDVGTFWFHPHVRTSEQIERGLYGTVIVEDEYVNQYSQDKVLVIDDWRLTSNYQIDPNFVTQHDLAHDGRWGNVITANSSTNESLNVRPGERIRLRLVNASNGRVYAPYFDGLESKIVAVDGMAVKEVVDADGFELAPGNRIDVDIIIPQAGYKTRYVINDRFTRNQNTIASIIVSGDPVETSYFAYPLNLDIPDWEDAFLFETDKEFRLNARRNEEGKIEWMINEKAFPEFDPFTFDYKKFNKISFVNESSRLHPMHLHGQFFKVISRNGQAVNEPYFRDTVLVHSKETVELGLVPLDKGDWVQHCHILEHADAGMLTVTSVK